MWVSNKKESNISLACNQSKLKIFAHGKNLIKLHKTISRTNVRQKII